MADDLTSNLLSTQTNPDGVPSAQPQMPAVADPTVVAPNLIPTEPPVVSSPVVPLEPISLPVQPVVQEPTLEVPPQPVVEQDVVQESPEPSLDDQPATSDQTVPPTGDGTDGAAAGDDKKSPLEILEEILAGANAEQDLKSQEEEAKKKKEDEEKAAFEAKKQVFAQEAQVKMVETKTALQEAAAVRQQVDNDILEKDKDKPAALGDEFAINQLSHDTIQTTE